MFIPASVSKTRVEREVKLHDPVKAWLGLCRREGRIVSVDISKRRRALCGQLGVLWKKNWLRHSFGSYRYAITKDLSGTADEMCHENISTFTRYYLNRGIGKAEAEAYWAIEPGAGDAGGDAG